MNMEEPTDPSDWPFQPLADLDGLMRCPICFDYFNIAVMIPNCSHNYCSLCIRRYLAVKQQCPTCSQAVAESQLQCNRLLDELVQSFKRNRKEFMKLSSSKERRKGSSKTSMLVSEKDKAKTSVQSTKKVEQSVSIEKRNSVVHVLDSPVCRVESKDKNVSTTTSSAAAGDGNTHLVPEPPGESQLDFGESQFLHELEEDNVLSAGNRTGVNKADVHVETEELSLNTGRTPAAAVDADITPQSNLSVNVSNESISMTATPINVRTYTSSHLSTPSRTPTAHNFSDTPTLSTPGTRVDPDTSRGSTTTPSSNKKVNCPVCSVAVFERFVNSHLDICLNQTSLSTGQSTSGRSNQLQKLPKLILTIMKDRELRKKCKVYHLSSQGSRSMLIDRINEFTLQYNAQRDSLHPKSMKEIAQDVERAEKGKQSIKKAASTPNATQIARRKSSTTEIEESRKKYELANDSHFSELIANIKSRDDQKTETSAKQEEGGGTLKPVCSPSSSCRESINEPSYSPVGGSGDEHMDDCVSGVQVCGEGCLENWKGGGRLDEEEIFVPESPELLSKGRYSTRQHQTIVVPESPSATRVGSPRESLKQVKRKLSTQLKGKRAAQNGLDSDSDPDFLPVTPHRSRKKQRRY